MFEQHMDEYLDEEVEVSKVTFDQICKAWELKVLKPINRPDL